jgi:hypothetical protein
MMESFLSMEIVSIRSNGNNMNSHNKFSDRSDIAPHDADRPEWQQERGERYGNRRKEISRLKWKERRKQRLKEKNLDFG